MNVRLKEIIEAANESRGVEGLSAELVSAIGAAFWAGQSDGIAAERAKTRERLVGLELGRYYQVEGRVARLFAPADEVWAADGLAAEAAEIKDWDFNL